MKLTSYIYHGPQSSASIRVTGLNNEEKELDILLYPEGVVSLPDKHEYTQTLLAQKLLTLTPTSAKTAKVDAKAKEQK